MRLFQLAAALFLFAMLGSVLAAPAIQPPSEAVCKAGRALVAGELSSVDAKAGLLTISVTELLCGNLDLGKHQVRLSTPLAQQLQAGSKVLVSIMTHRKILGSSALQPQPGGAQVTREQGLEPALFGDSRIIRQLLAGPGDDREAYMDVLMQGLQHPLARVRGLAATEIAFRPALFERLASDQGTTLVAAAASPDLPPGARRELILAAKRAGVDFAIEPWRAVIIDVLAGMPLQLDARTEYPSLVLMAIERYAGPVDDARLTRWVASDHHAVVEASLRKVFAVQPQLAVALAQAQQHQALMHPPLRRVIERFLARHAGVGKD